MMDATTVLKGFVTGVLQHSKVVVSSDFKLIEKDGRSKSKEEEKRRRIGRECQNKQREDRKRVG